MVFPVKKMDPISYCILPLMIYGKYSVEYELYNFAMEIVKFP